MYADIAVCLPLVRTFVYRVNQSVETGCRVIVPFRKREVEGFVVGFRKDAPRDLEVHDIGSVVDQSSLLRPDIFQLCRWIADYYVSPIGEVLKAALPPGILPKHLERGLKRATTCLEKSSYSDLVAGFSPRPILTPDQSSALSTINNSPGFHPILLHGVTGSGKTEIYMRA